MIQNENSNLMNATALGEVSLTRKQILVIGAAFSVYEFLVVLIFTGMEDCRRRSCEMPDQVLIWLLFFSALGFVGVVVAWAALRAGGKQNRSIEQTAGEENQKGR